jgi:hypothetical protein
MAIPNPEPKDWALSNAQVLQKTDREVLAMLRGAYRTVNAELKALVAKDSVLVSEGVRRAQLKQTIIRLQTEQAAIFTRLGDITSARRLEAAARSQRLSAADDAHLLRLVGMDAEAQFLYESALQTSQRGVDAALARMGLSELPLSQRIYRTSVWMSNRLGTLINQALISNLNAKEFAKKARDWFNPNTPGGVRYAAMRLARTEINNSFHAISAQKYDDTPWITNVEWNLSKSHPKPDECNVLAKESPYKTNETPARPHPQCMCYITPVSVDEDEFVENFLKGDYDDYLDSELEKNGWQEPESPPDAKPMKKSLTFDDRFDLAAKDHDALDSVPWGLERRPRPPEFNQDMVRGLNRYTGVHYEKINSHLRHEDLSATDTEFSKKIITDIDPAFGMSKTTKESVAYRGIADGSKLFGDRMNGDMSGMEWIEEAYTSTTALKRRTSPFLNRQGLGQSLLMRMIIPEGTPAIEGSPYNAEAEILLGRGRRMRLVKDHGLDDEGIRHIDVEVVNVNADGEGEGKAGRPVQGSDTQGTGASGAASPKTVIRQKVTGSDATQ